MKQKECKGRFIVLNDKGLHMRPSTELVKRASLFQSQIVLTCHNSKANGKSLLSVLMLAAKKGTEIQVQAIGEDAELVVNELINLAKNLFNIKY
jgi:phosphocarrier protein HPr